MKKLIAIAVIMFGITFTTQAASPVVKFGQAIGEIIMLPVGIVVGTIEGIGDGVVELVEYIFTDEEDVKPTVTPPPVSNVTIKSPNYIVVQKTEPIPIPVATPNVNIVNSPGTRVSITETSVSTTNNNPPTTTVIKYDPVPHVRLFNPPPVYHDWRYGY